MTATGRHRTHRYGTQHVAVQASPGRLHGAPCDGGRPGGKGNPRGLHSALEVLQGWMAATPRVLAIRGEPVVIYGIVATPRMAGRAAPWLAIISTIAHDDLTNVMWLSRDPVDVRQRRWPVLQTVCDARNQFHRQWLDWLGFERRGRVEAFGAAALPLELHERRRSTTLHGWSCRRAGGQPSQQGHSIGRRPARGGPAPPSNQPEGDPCVRTC